MKNPWIEKYVAEYWKTKSFLTSMQLEAAGWQEKMLDRQAAAMPAVFLYAFDLPTEWIWMCSVPLGHFVRMSEHAAAETAAVDDIRGGGCFCHGRRR